MTRRRRRLTSPDSGEIAYKPLNHRAGNAGMFRRTCGDLLACFLHLHARLRVRRTPGIPCALCSLEGHCLARLGHDMPRERESMSRTHPEIAINQAPLESMQSEYRSMLDQE